MLLNRVIWTYTPPAQALVYPRSSVLEGKVPFTFGFMNISPPKMNKKKSANFIQWPKNGQVGTQFTDLILNSEDNEGKSVANRKAIALPTRESTGLSGRMRCHP